jgi:hypothetical protein
MNRRARITVWALRLLLLALSALSYWGQMRLGLTFVFVGAFVLVVMAPQWLIRGAESLHLWLRQRMWAAEEGHHHAFAGVAFTMADDGRHMWLQGDALKRVLARPEADDVLAARISGKWKLDERGRLWLRVDAVVEHLASFPGRMDPRVQKLRRWLERDVLFPADRRHSGR